MEKVSAKESKCTVNKEIIEESLQKTQLHNIGLSGANAELKN